MESDNNEFAIESSCLAALIETCSGMDVCAFFDGRGRFQLYFEFPLPFNASYKGSLVSVLGDRANAFVPFADFSLREIIFDSDIDIDGLSLLKTYFKKLADTATGDEERDIFILSYFTVIAAALVFRKRKISSHKNRYLETKFHELSCHDQIAKEFQDLFSRASECCEVKGES